MIEWKGQRVITTAQLAEVYGASEKQIKQNFNNNAKHFQEEKYYFLLKGAELKTFANQVENFDPVCKHSASIYLWTRRGASRHCKMLGTERAWEQFDYLEDNYFNRDRPQRVPTTIPGQIQLLAQGYVELEQKVNNVEQKVVNLENNMTIDYGQQRVLGEAVNKTVIDALGGKSSYAYKEISKKVFAECDRDLKHYFNVNSRNNVPKKRFEEAIEYARNWKPCTNTMMMIHDCNAQQELAV